MTTQRISPNVLWAILVFIVLAATILSSCGVPPSEMGIGITAETFKPDGCENIPTQSDGYRETAVDIVYVYHEVNESHELITQGRITHDGRIAYDITPSGEVVTFTGKRWINGGLSPSFWVYFCGGKLYGPEAEIFECWIPPDYGFEPRGTEYSLYTPDGLWVGTIYGDPVNGGGTFALDNGETGVLKPGEAYTWKTTIGVFDLIVDCHGEIWVVTISTEPVPTPTPDWENS